MRLDQLSRCMTNFLGSLEAAKYLKNTGALSLISKNPFILEIKKKKVLAMEIFR